MKGTKNMVTLCAKTINSKGNFPNDTATIQPNIITTEINTFTFFELKLDPKPNASPNNAPPTVAFPTREENDAPNNPIKKQRASIMAKQWF